MKKLFFRSLLLAGALTVAWNCSDDPISPKAPEYVVTADAWLLQAGSDYIIYHDGSVTNAQGDLVGTFTLVDGLGVVIDAEGAVICDNIDLAALTTLQKNTTVYTLLGSAWHLQDATGDYLIYPAAEGATACTVTDADGNPVGILDLASMTIIAADGVTPLTTVADIATLPVLNPGDKFTKKPDVIIVESSSSVEPPPVSSSVEPVSSSSEKSSSSSAKSSSSSAKSSSSSAKSSSSVQSSSSKTGGCPAIKTKSGGRSGSGWATRYWDCCKPHCSWPENANGNYSRQCTNKGKNESTDWGGASVCGGGGLMTCTSQIPFTVDGCDDMAFAFAAVPAADGGSCGKCYQLTFTGNGKYIENANGAKGDANTNAIKGKKLIIMATNIGGDVQQGQFDIMIPGGGVGMFNGCGGMGWGNQGKQYGGLLSDCEESVGYSGNLLKKRTECLTEKCNSVFSNDNEAKQGCLFLANWMQAAGNPMHNYVEVECPEVLKQKY